MSFWNTQRQLHKDLSKESTILKKAPMTINDYKILAEQAYLKSPSESIVDWKLIKHNKNNKMYQNRSTGELVNAISGSKSLSDFANDGLQYLGFHNNTFQKKRFKDSEQFLKPFNTMKHKQPLVLTSHSLGSNVANRLLLNGEADKSINFNAFIPDNRINIDDERVVNIRNRKDFASIKTRNNDNTIELNGGNYINAHFLDKIDSLNNNIYV